MPLVARLGSANKSLFEVISLMENNIEEPLSREELAIIDGVQRSLADVEAGHVIPHDAAMDEVQAVIDAAKSGKA